MTEILDAMKSSEDCQAEGYEVTSFKNAKLNRILREINGYGYKVISTNSSSKVFSPKGGQLLAWTDHDEKFVVVFISSIIHHNSLRKKFNLIRWDLTETMVHELSHVIEKQTVYQPVILQQDMNLQWSKGYSNADEIVHSEWFWHIYHTLCIKYHIRHEEDWFNERWRNVELEYLLAEDPNER